MKIAQINICDNGSTGKIMTDILTALDSDAEKVAFVSHKYTDKDYVRPIHSRNQYRMHKFMARYLGRDEWGDLSATKRLIASLREFDPDILHLHNIHSYTLNYRLLFDYIKSDSVNVVWTLHDCWAFTGGCPHFDEIGCNRWEKGCGNCPDLKTTGLLYGADNTARTWERKKESFSGVKNMIIVTPSSWLKRLAAKSFLGQYDIRVVNNGVDLDNFTYTDEHTFDNIIDRKYKILLGVASPFTEKKGYGDFLGLSRILPESYKIVLVGLSEGQRQNLPENVIGISKTDNQVQLAELYSLAYAFVNLTYEDTFSMVNIEALSCGTPVICYNTGGATEMLTAENSIVLEKGRYGDIIGELDKIETLRGNRDTFGKDARKKYSSYRMTNDYRDLYGVLTARKGKNERTR